MWNVRAFIILVPLLLAAGIVTGGDGFPAADDDLNARIEAVSEGELLFLSAPPEGKTHHHINRITITESSLDDGWVKLEQCHEHLDPVGALEIVFHPETIRNITILSRENIGASRVEASRVDLEDIRPDARICIAAESRALVRTNGDSWQLRNGPYMRKFLDGYYPMQVTLVVLFSASPLELVSYAPHPGLAGHVEQRNGVLDWNAWFEGRLNTEVNFVRAR